MARGTAIAAVAVLTFGAGTAAATVLHLGGNVRHVDALALTGPKPTKSVDPDDPNAGEDLNILVIGSDQRDGENGDLGGLAGLSSMRSDTAMVMHISADRSRVDVVSIPRDSLVDIPSCTMSDGTTLQPRPSVMFNSAFAYGWDYGGDMASAAGCTIKTVQHNTGIAIDHFVIVDFAGFKDMVNAIDGVPICIPNRLYSKKARLHLEAGEQRLNGKTALAFARARTGEGLGDGSDINRIGNQQRLVAAMASEVLSSKVLTNPTKLLPFLDAATGSVTVDKGFTLTDMVGVAYSMRSIRGGNISFMTIPWTSAPNDRNRVVWAPEAAQVWENIANDRPMDGKEHEPTTPSSTPTPGSTATSKPSKPTPQATKQAGREAFSLDDKTADCS